MNVKALLVSAAKKTLATIFTSSIAILLAAVLKGESLSGLSHVGGLLDFVHGEVPLWWVFVVIAALLGLSGPRLAALLSQKNRIPGLINFQMRFNAFDYEPTMDSQELLMIFNDGRSWISNHKEALERRVLERKQPVRVLLLHPKSDFLKTQIKKSRRSPREQNSILKTSFETLERLRVHSPNLVEIRGHFLYNTYILHLNEKLALYHPMFINERGELPIFSFSKSEGKSFYDQLKADALKAWDSAVPITEKDFSSTRNT